MIDTTNRRARRLAAMMIMTTMALAGHTHAASAQKSTKARKEKAPAHTRFPEPPHSLWSFDVPAPLPGSILPEKRIVAFYGNPLSKGMGILGALPPDKMLAKLDSEVAAWNAADPSHPVQPALQLIAVVADRTPGKSGKYRTRMDSALIERVYNMAHDHGALFFLDIQVGQGTLQQELPRLTKYLMRPDVHLAVDPEFSMKHHEIPGTVTGTLDAADINYASTFLQQIVDQYHLPPKVFVIHRFRHDMLTNYKNIELDARVQIVINMDGWGPPWQKIDSYRAYVEKYPVEYTGFKLFYKNDRRLKGSVLMTPADVLALFPQPLYIQYQ